MRISYYLLTSIVMLFFSSTLFSQKKWSLDDCIDYADKNNLQVQQVQYAGRINEAYLQQAKAQRLPSLSTTVGAGYAWGLTFDQATLQQINGGYYTGSFSSSLTMPIFKGGSLQNSIHQNKLLVEAGNYDVEATKENLNMMIAQVYLQILQLEEQIENNNNQITSSSEQLKNTKAMFEKGIVAENFVLQQEAQIASEQWELQQNINSLSNAKITLMQLMEMPVTDDFEIEKPDLENIQLVENNNSVTNIYQTALGIRPQVKSAQLNTESSVIGVRVAKGTQLPSLSFVAGLSSSYSSARQSVDYTTSVQDVAIGYLASDPTESVLGTSVVNTPTINDYNVWNQFDDFLTPSVGVSLSIPIFSNRLYKTNIEVAKINSELAKLNERDITNQLRKDIELAYSDLDNSDDQYLAAEKQLNYAGKTFRNAKYQYANGLISPTDFFIEKNNFATAENNLVLAKYQYLFSKIVLDFYSGKSLKLN